MSQSVEHFDPEFLMHLSLMQPGKVAAMIDQELKTMILQVAISEVAHYLNNPTHKEWGLIGTDTPLFWSLMNLCRASHSLAGVFDPYRGRKIDEHGKEIFDEQPRVEFFTEDGPCVLLDDEDESTGAAIVEALQRISNRGLWKSEAEPDGGVM
jgi:hypothetical protein